MADASLAVLSRNEVISCHRKTDPEPRASKTALDRTTSTAESSSVSQDSRDSGYSSPGRHPISDSQDRVQGDRPSRPKGIAVKLGGQNLFRFKNTTSKPTIARLNYVIDQIEPLLLASLKKTGDRVAPMALRTMTLGTNEDDAGEYIVVLCRKKLLNTVNDFFDKTEIIQELCEPTAQTPRLSIIVEGREPRLTAKLLRSHLSIGRHPIGVHSMTLSGRSLRLKGTHKDGKIAIFGGVIKVVDMNSQSKFYGMTAGHVFNEEDTTEVAETSVENPESGGRTGVPLELRWDSGDWMTPRACRILTKDESDEKGPNFDWALVHFDDLFESPAHAAVTFNQDGLSAEVGEFSENESDQEVEINRNGAATCSGLLSCEPARVLLGTSDAFTPVYILTLNKGEVGEGDSGAWTVGSVSRDVFGHTVATDLLDDVYVVPLDQTFKDIQRSLGAESVHLAVMVNTEPSFPKYHSTSSPRRHTDSAYCSMDPSEQMEDIPLELLEEAYSGIRRNEAMPGAVSGLEEQGRQASPSTNASEDVSPERQAKRRRLSTEASSGETFARKAVTVEHTAQDMPECNKGDRV